MAIGEMEKLWGYVRYTNIRRKDVRINLIWDTALSGNGNN
jgi:hypothetical protein